MACSAGDGEDGLKPIDDKAKAKRAALNALRRARRAAELAGVKLSDWEGEFLGSVEGRVEKYGRAFADPDLGAMNGALSLRQGIKLKEIAAKTRRKGDAGDAGDAKAPKTATFGARKSGFGKSQPRKSGFGKPKSGGLKRRSSFSKRSGKLQGK